LVQKSLPYLVHAYKVTGDVPGINYLLSSFYLHVGAFEKAFRHLSNAIGLDRTLYSDFEELFPGKLITRKMKKLLDETSGQDDLQK
jgi:hypothetical protein